MISRRRRLWLAYSWRNRFPDGPHDHGCVLERTYELADSVIGDIASALEAEGSPIRLAIQTGADNEERFRGDFYVWIGAQRFCFPFSISPRRVHFGDEQMFVGYGHGAQHLMLVILNMLAALKETEEEALDPECH